MGFLHCDISLSENSCLPKWAWAAYFRQQHQDYLETGAGIECASKPELKPTLAMIWSLSRSVLASSERESRYGLLLRHKRLAWQKDCKRTRAWWQAFELWESASAYRYHAMHTKVAHLRKHINKNKLLLKFTQNAAWEHGRKGIVNEDMKC